ncbi:MAG TPA: TadE family protein [Anaerolineae bacterium]|nr:TadE family protein [Anaerolineae bacterium]
MSPSNTTLAPSRRSPRRPVSKQRCIPGKAPVSARLGSSRARLPGPWWPRVAASPRDDEPRGQAIVEFALVASFLFLILFGIVDFSRLFFAYATMANGVREGARFASAQPDDDAAILDHAHAMMVLIGDEATVTVSFPDTDAQGNSHCSHYCRVVVTARSDFDVWTPVIPHVEIVTQSTMHVE